MRLTITPDEAILHGHNLLSSTDPPSFLAVFGTPTRSREIKMHPAGSRIAMVWDELGLVAYEDQPEGRMSHLYLAFDPAETPERPARPAEVTIEMNGADFAGETTERSLPRSGATPIVSSFGGKYYYTADRFAVDFAFEKRRNDQGKKGGSKRLAYVSFTWKYPSPALG